MRGNTKVFNKFVQHGGGLFITTITFAELSTWAYRASAPLRRKQTLIELMNEVKLFSFDAMIADFSGQLRASLMDQGINVPSIDFFNGATAVFHNFTMVTHNVEDYEPSDSIRHTPAGQKHGGCANDKITR
jgi:predicted nucleic acid-binding protein